MKYNVQMDMELCGCKRSEVRVFSSYQHSSSDGVNYEFADTTCGVDAFARGSGQKVVSYVFYVSPKSSQNEANVYFQVNYT